MSLQESGASPGDSDGGHLADLGGGHWRPGVISASGCAAGHGGSLAEDLSFQARFKLPRRARGAGPGPAVEQELCRFGTGGPGRGRRGLMDIGSSWNEKGVHFKPASASVNRDIARNFTPRAASGENFG
jgi:hypothetical protein